jgi:hypothetical protein
MLPRPVLPRQFYLVTWGCAGTGTIKKRDRQVQTTGARATASVTTTRRSEIDWVYRGVGRFFPEAWHRSRAGVPEVDRDGDLVAAVLSSARAHVLADRGRTEWSEAE